MFSLSHYHYNEIKEIPELMEMVDNIDREDFFMFFNPHRFAELCMQHNCPETFLAVAPYTDYEFGTIGELMRHNAVEIVQYMQENSGGNNRWEEAIRHVATSGNRASIQFVLDHIKVPDIHKYIVQGACRGDHPQLLEEFLLKMLEPNVHSTASEISVQCNAVKCLGYLLSTMSSDTWADSLDEAVQFKNSTIISLLLDNAPEQVDKDLQFWANLTSSSFELDDPRPVLEWVLANTTLKALLECHGSRWYVSKDKRQRLIAIHENIELSYATALLGAPSKRKVM